MLFLNHIKAIEAKAYPKSLWGLQDFRYPEDLVEYCGAHSWTDMLVLSGDHWYFIATISTGEIVDLASTTPLSYKDLLRIKYYLQVVFKGRQIHFEALESTSYRFVRRFNRIGRVLEDKPFIKKGLSFHKVVIEID